MNSTLMDVITTHVMRDPRPITKCYVLMKGQHVLLEERRLFCYRSFHSIKGFLYPLMRKD
jgi:hypothetical protein